MNISEKGKALIKSYEGCRLTAYKCPAGVWTIGWGRTGGVREGQRITQAQADMYFNEDIKKYEAPVQRYSGLNQNQFDALVSFCYNCGQWALKDVMESGNITGTMRLYNKGGGQVLPGLVRRRNEEIELYNTPVASRGDEYEEKGTFYPNTTINFRNKPIVSKDNPIQGQYYKHENVKYDRVFKGNGYVWISWLSSNKIRRYMPIREFNNNKYGSLWGRIE